MNREQRLTQSQYHRQDHDDRDSPTIPSRYKCPSSLCVISQFSLPGIHFFNIFLWHRTRGSSLQKSVSVSSAQRAWQVSSHEFDGHAKMPTKLFLSTPPSLRPTASLLTSHIHSLIILSLQVSLWPVTLR